MIGDMKTLDLSLPPRILQMEAIVYNALGRIALEEGTKESAKAAVEYFEKLRDISKAIGFVEGVALAEANIAMAMAEYEGNSSVSNEEAIENDQEMYKRMTRGFGEGSPDSVQAGVNLANTLDEANRFLEAERLLTKLAVMSRRVHGPDHNLSKAVASSLQEMKARRTVIRYQQQECQ